MKFMQKPQTTSYDVIIIGAGAAGLMAAGQAAKSGANVLLIDRNQKVGRKLLITGKGRCNITNNCEHDKLMSSIMRNSSFLFGAFSQFTPQDTMAFFESIGVPLKTERGNRVFPTSDRAMDVVDSLFNYIKKLKVTLIQGRVSSLVMEDYVVTGVKTLDNKIFTAKSIVIATGGLSYPATGSVGDGYLLAKQAGHTVTPTSGSLVPIVLSDNWCPDVMGLSLINVTLTVKKGDKTVFCELGEMMFTHFGISGPLVLSASALMEGSIKDYKMFVDLKPGLSENQLDARLLRDFDESKNKTFKNALNRLLPQSLIPIVVQISSIDELLQVNSITKEQRKQFVSLLKAFPLTPRELRPIDEAVVTKGGVSVKEINPKTMASKLAGGLFFAGEVMDLDAVTGGYNLQIAWSTGYLAGSYAAQHSDEV